MACGAGIRVIQIMSDTSVNMVQGELADDNATDYPGPRRFVTHLAAFVVAGRGMRIAEWGRKVSAVRPTVVAGRRNVRSVRGSVASLKTQRHPRRLNVTETYGRQIVAEQLYATLKTNQGDIEVRLLPNHAPKTVKNFVELAKGEREWTHPATGETSTDKLYDGTVFHRVISGFMIQGGDPLGNGTGGPGYEFADEFHPDLSFNKPYLLAMANAGPGTNGSQFFVTVSPTAWLTGKHTIFGEVVDPASQKVVDAIAGTQTNARTDRPVQDIVIESVVVETR
jgi:peptidyl-prolyl cis-trans isomerase A (cyclophilin A)